MITITLDPALRPDGATQSHVFNDGVDTITIGRSPECGVQLKPDLTKLGRTHFELRRAASGVELVTDREHPVFVDGQRVVERLMLSLRQELRLLDPMTGPVIRIVCEKTGDALVTEENALSDSGTQQGMLTGLKRQGRSFAIAASIAALCFGGYLYWDAQQRSARDMAFLKSMDVLAQRMTEAEAQQANWAEVQAKVKPSVYQVTFADASGGKPLHQGTAWVYGKNKLATNAHVASIFNNPTLQGRILLVPADPSLPSLPVISVELHPAYLAYRKTVGETQSVGRISPLANLGSYDVAFLEVPENSVLGPALALAEETTVLAPGESVAYLGYPERCARHADQLHIKSGIISGTSDFLGSSSAQELIYHTAPGAGGASGSPLINSKGEVVGVFSGGEPAKPVEAVPQPVADGQASQKAELGCGTSGAATLYAQYVGLLRELESGTAFEKQATREAQWRNSANYKLNQDQVWATVANLSEDAVDGEGGVAVRRASFTQAAQTKSAFSSTVTSFEGLSAGRYVAFANVAPEDRVTLVAHVNDVALNVPVSVEGKPTAVFDLKQSGTLSVTLAGPTGKNVDVIVARLDDGE
jgi:hypothetical protein